MEFPAALREAQYRNYALANMFSLNAIWCQRTIVAWLAWGVVAGLLGVVWDDSGAVLGAFGDVLEGAFGVMLDIFLPN